MRKSIAMLAVAMLLAVGCQNKDNGSMNDSSTSGTMTPKKMTTDACAHCAGDQVATADGKCPMCGGKVK